MPDAKPHISATQIEMYGRCQYQWFLRYGEDGWPSPPGIAILTGKAWHGGIEANGRQKIRSHRDLPADDIVGESVARFEGATHEGYSLSKEERSIGPRKVVGRAKDQVAALARLYAAEIAPDYQPLLVEHRVLIPFPNASHDLLGVVDLLDDRHRVVDFKTSSKKKRPADADLSTQLTIYGAAYWQQTGRQPTGLRLDVGVKTKTPVRQIVETARSERDFAVLVNRINVMLAGIKSGVFAPADPGSWQCDPRWCGYYDTVCPYVNSGKRR